MSKTASLNPLDVVRMLHAAGGPLLAQQALLHAKLAGVELKEERNRLLRMLAVTLLGFACLLCTLLFAGGLAIAATWESGYRIPTLAALAILFGGCTYGAWRRLQAQSALGSQSFAASREELAADTALLKACT